MLGRLPRAPLPRGAGGAIDSGEPRLGSVLPDTEGDFIQGLGLDTDPRGDWYYARGAPSTLAMIKSIWGDEATQVLVDPEWLKKDKDKAKPPMQLARGMWVGEYLPHGPPIECRFRS